MADTIRQTLYEELNRSGDPPVFTTKVVAEILRLPLRRITVLIEQKIVESQEETAPGRGKSHRFGFVDIQLFALFDRLSQQGLAPRHLRHLAPTVRALVEDYNGLAKDETARKYADPALKERPKEHPEEFDWVFPQGLIVLYRDDAIDDWRVEPRTYLDLATVDYSGAPPDLAYTIIDLGYLVEGTFNKMCERNWYR